jgi:hypothetical protein
MPITRSFLNLSPLAVSIPFLMATNFAPRKTEVSTVDCRLKNQISGAEFRNAKKPVGKGLTNRSPAWSESTRANKSQPPCHGAGHVGRSGLAHIAMELLQILLLEQAHLNVGVPWVKDHAGVMFTVQASKDAVDRFQVAISWAR